MGGDSRYGTGVTFKNPCGMGVLTPTVPAGTRGVFLGKGTDSGGCTHIVHLLDGPEEAKDYYNGIGGFRVRPFDIEFDDSEGEEVEESTTGL